LSVATKGPLQTGVTEKFALDSDTESHVKQLMVNYMSTANILS
jgi:hypothetical protein